MYYVAFVWSVLCVFLLIFCLENSSIDESVVLKSLATIVFLHIPPFRNINICFIFIRCSYIRCTYLALLYSAVGVTILSLLVIFFVSYYSVFWRRNGNPLQCSCLENPRDRGAWWAAVYGVAQSQTRLKQLSSTVCFNIYIFWSKYSHHNFLGVFSCMEYLFLPLYF